MIGDGLLGGYAGQQMAQGPVDSERMRLDIARWEKEQAERATTAYRERLIHLATTLLIGHHGDRYTPESALKAANDLCVGAKGYSP